HWRGEGRAERSGFGRGGLIELGRAQIVRHRCLPRRTHGVGAARLGLVAPPVQEGRSRACELVHEVGGATGGRVTVGACGTTRREPGLDPAWLGSIDAARKIATRRERVPQAPTVTLPPVAAHTCVR